MPSFDDPNVYPRVTLNGTEVVPISQGGFGRTTTVGAIARLAQVQSGVVSVAGRNGDVTLSVTDVAGAYASSNPSGFITSAALAPYALTSSLSVYALSANLATVATTGSYTDLTNKPSVGSGTITGVTAGTGLSGGGTTGTVTLTVAYGSASGTAAQGNDSRITGALQASNNLSDVGAASTARTNLGLGSSATHAAGDFLLAANNLSDVTAATARTNLGISTVGNTGAYTDLTGRPSGSATLSFGMAAVVAAGTLYVDVPYAATLTTLKYNVGSAGGSFTVSVQIAGTNVTGLTSIAVSSSSDNTATATAANTLTAGQRVGFVFSSVSGSPTDAVLTLTWTH